MQEEIKNCKEQEVFVKLPKCVLETLICEIEEIKRLLQTNIAEEVKHRWVSSDEARKILGISAKTWQTFRDERKIPFSQFGRKIYVRESDLDAFFESNVITK